MAIQVKVCLSRRNLLTLLNKLDEVKRGGKSECTLVKYDTTHPTYPITAVDENGVVKVLGVAVKAVEDEDYYADRMPGAVRWFSGGGDSVR